MTRARWTFVLLVVLLVLTGGERPAVVTAAVPGGLDRQAPRSITAFAVTPAQAAAELPVILTLRQQSTVYNDWLKLRLERILPELMRQEGFDMWLVICRENNEDPVFPSLVPFTNLYASRTSMLVFFDKGAEGVERLTVSRSNIGSLYKSVWEPEKVDQWVRLAQIIKERNPKRIGINRSDTFNYGDGISASLEKKLLASLPADLASRVESAERLAVRWLERRSPDELEVYPQIVAIAHRIIAEAFSRAVIQPGITTTDDVVWWMRERSAAARPGQLVPALGGHSAAEGEPVQRRRHPPRGRVALRLRDHLLASLHRHAGDGVRGARWRDGRAQGAEGRVCAGQPAAGHPAGRNEDRPDR